MNISFADVSLAKAGALALVVTEGNSLSGAAADLDRKSGGALKRAVKAADFTGKAGSVLEIVALHGVAASRVYLIGVGKAAELSISALENAGGELVGSWQKAKETAAAVIADGAHSAKIDAGEAAARIAFGAKLRSYRFDKYKTKKKDDNGAVKSLAVMTKAFAAARKSYGT